MKKYENHLDERQEQILLKIEHNGCWFAFWALLAAIAVEGLIFRMDMKAIAGEWIVFMALALYMFGACMKNNIWDRRLKPDGKTNLIVSLIASVSTGLIMALSVWMRYPKAPIGSLASGLFIAVIVFIPCMLCLTLSANQLKKQLKKEEEAEEE